MSEFEKRGDIVDTTDCLEAISALKGMKNGLFTLILLGLLLMQAIFWLNYLGYIDKSGCSMPCKTCVMVCDARSAWLGPLAATDAPSTREPVNPATEPTAKPVEAGITPEMKETATTVMAEAEKAVGVTTEKTAEKSPKSAAGDKPKWPLGKYDKFLPKCVQVMWTIRVANFVVLLMMILYCLSLLVILKISLAGRLGGLNHIVRAFFRSLLALIFLVPWQTFFPGVLVGAMYMPAELLCSSGCPDTTSVFALLLHFLRFGGLWLLVILLLFSAQLRSRKWSQATLRRLGILQ